MKTTAIMLVFGLFVLPALSQTTKVKKTEPAKSVKTILAKAKATPKKSVGAKPVAAKTKTTSAPKKPAVAKSVAKKPNPKPTTKKPNAKESVAKKPNPKSTTKKPAGMESVAKKPKPKPTTKKPNAKESVAKKPKPKPTTKKPNAKESVAKKPNPKPTTKKPNAKESVAKKPKPKPTPPVVDEDAEFEKASALTDAAERVAALRKFVDLFPNSKKNVQASDLIARARAELGFLKLQAGDMDAAAAIFLLAATDTPKPVPDQLFTDIIAKMPTNLFFRGQREKALEIAKITEEKADGNASQLLNLATFYMSIESGSDARRLAGRAILLEPNSSAAYQTLGLADRMDFQLEDSAAAYAKALELEPSSLTARRGLAEMKRSLGRADEAVRLYREILTQDVENLPARTGLILALFDAGKRVDAEAEMTTSLAANPNNVILLAGAAYWYAAHDEGDKAVDLAQKAAVIEPRFIWSHIAFARGLMLQKKPIDAERTLLAARRYGNFPTLEYEIAAAQLTAGFYREAAEELSKHFLVKAGVIQVDLGGRVPKESKYFTELVGFERRASIFAPTAADNPELAGQLRSLLEFTQELESDAPRAEAVTTAADEFIRGNDKMKIHRQLFVAARLLDKKLALPTVLELTKAAAANADAALDDPNATAAVIATELYESRSIANAKGEYIRVPDVPRQTLSAILRGRIEEINGWGLYEMDNPTEAIIHLKRAVSVMPLDSSWWRSSMWRLGSALALGGKDAEALDAYIKSYRSGSPDPSKYAAVEAIYKRVNGNTDGLEAKIGPKPTPPVSESVVAQKTETSSTPEVKPEPTPSTNVENTAARDAKVEPTPEASRTPAAPPIVPIGETAKPEPTPEPKVGANETNNVRVEQTPEVPVKEPSKSEPTPSPRPEKIETPAVAAAPKPTPVATPEPANSAKELFPPIIINIPAPNSTKPAETDAPPKAEPSPKPSEKKETDEPKKTEPDSAEKPKSGSANADAPRPRVVEEKPNPSAEVPSCKISVSEDSISLQNAGGNLAILVGIEGDGDLASLTAKSSSPNDVEIKPGPEVAGLKDRVLYIVRSLTARPGIYQVVFELECGKKEILVKVR